MLTLFDKFLKRQTEESPTDILVGLICAQILKEPLALDQMGFTGGLYSREWSWPDQRLSLTFEIVKDSKGCAATVLKRLRFEREDIQLTPAQQKPILAALNKCEQLSKARQKIDAQAANENRALDAIAKIMGVAPSGD